MTITAAKVGIEAISAYCGAAYVDASEIARVRGASPQRVDKLMLGEKTVSLPGEDVVTFAVNAAAPLLEGLDSDTRSSIELLVIGTESGIDYSKSVGTWVHELLGLPRSCRLFEVKQACYGGVAALQLAAAQIAASGREGARALVIASDMADAVQDTARAIRWTSEAALGAGAVAALVSSHAGLAFAEFGKVGYHSFNVDDYYRPGTSGFFLDPDVSLRAYSECLQRCWADYCRFQPEADFLTEFDHLAFHMPGPSVVKGSHRSLLRNLGIRSPHDADEDFTTRIEPSTRYPRSVGNVWAACALLAFASLLDNAKVIAGQRVGIYSFGSGCSSELCRYVLGPGIESFTGTGIAQSLRNRTELDLDTYEELSKKSSELTPGLADYSPDLCVLEKLSAPMSRPLVALTGIRDHHRSYATVGENG